MPDISEFDALRALSARVGSDPLQVQAAGGNTSLKSDDTLWIKASGTWLANAQTSDLFVPVSLPPLREALAKGDARAEKSTDFVRADLNPGGLRPSIETTVHAVLPQKVVVHIHCVDTIALAIREDAASLLGTLLADFHWAWIPYFRPGLPLSKGIAARLEPGVEVLVLGNHGLVVAAETVADASDLLARVRTALQQPVRPATEPDAVELERLTTDTDYAPASDTLTHALALDSVALGVATGGSLYPDHVIFLGDGAAALPEGGEVPWPLNASDERDPSGAPDDIADQPPMMLIAPGAGVLMHRNANTSQHAMARCLADVCRRVPQNAAVHYLGEDDLWQLLNWEAESYRQSIAT